MPSQQNQNDYLVRLLSLQQDGKGAISAPSNWTRKPLLEVATELDGIVEHLADTLLYQSGENLTARWHFFIGSPGNGKSAAMGKLCRTLSEHGCQVKNQEGTSIEDLGESEVPYDIDVYEGDNPFVSAKIIQDASVVRRPFADEVDPARDLQDILSDCWLRRRSLVVCTNRGVLEKAHEDGHVKPDINSTPWFKVLSGVISAKYTIDGTLGDPRQFDGKSSLFKEVKVTYSHLDNHSLLLNRNTFSSLIETAVDDVNWEACGSCSYREKCPFKKNQEWLTDPQGRQAVLTLLTRAEVFSGQVIVFREALALISFMLAGCSRDYDDMHPCAWVEQRISSNAFFALAARRIYMCLFASHYPCGLESESALRKRQLGVLKDLCHNLSDAQAEVADAVRQVTDGCHPSTEVGVERLLGQNQIVEKLDPIMLSLPQGYYERWDADYEAMWGDTTLGLGDIEKECLRIWRMLEQEIEFVAEHGASSAHWAIHRWSSNFLLHYGALAEGKAAWSKELDAFANLLRIASMPPGDRSLDERRQLRVTNAGLERLLRAFANDSEEVPLSDNVSLKGTWVSKTLEPLVHGDESPESLALEVHFSGKESSILGADMFLWLSLYSDGRLDSRCVPSDLIAGLTDARIRAASKGGYAFQNDDVEVVIKFADGSTLTLERFDGDVSYG